MPGDYHAVSAYAATVASHFLLVALRACLPLSRDKKKTDHDSLYGSFVSLISPFGWRRPVAPPPSLRFAKETRQTTGGQGTNQELFLVDLALHRVSFLGTESDKCKSYLLWWYPRRSFLPSNDAGLIPCGRGKKLPSHIHTSHTTFPRSLLRFIFFVHLVSPSYQRI